VIDEQDDSPINPLVTPKGAQAKVLVNHQRYNSVMGVMTDTANEPYEVYGDAAEAPEIN